MVSTEPALGCGVGDDAVRRRPAGSEQLGEDRLLGVQQALAVLRVRPALFGEQEAGAGDGRACAGLKGALDVAALRDPTGEKQRVVTRQGRLCPIEQLERGQASAHVASRLDALDDDRVGAGGVGCTGLPDRAALVDPDARDPAPRGAPESDDDIGRGGGLEPAAAGEGQQQIDGERPPGQPPRRGELPLDCASAVDGDRPQAARLGHRGGQLVAAQPTAHPGLQDGHFDTEAFEQRHFTILGPPAKPVPTPARSLREDAVVADSFKLVVLASGSGTNLQAILDRLHGRGGIRVVAVGSDKVGAPALERARNAGIETASFPREGYADREARDAAMGDWVQARGADLVVLAGYMQLLSEGFVARFRNRVVNIHPALLPEFPGLDAIGQALAAGVEVTGVTVHFVDEGVDTGPVILQRRVPVPDDRDRAALEATIHATEHELYPEAIRMIAAGRVRIDANDPRTGRGR